MVTQAEVDDISRRVSGVVAGGTVLRDALQVVAKSTSEGLLDDLMPGSRLREWVEEVDSLFERYSQVSSMRPLLACLGLALQQQTQRVLKMREEVEAYRVRADAFWTLGNIAALLDHNFASQCYVQASTLFAHIEDWARSGMLFSSAAGQLLDAGYHSQAALLYEVAGPLLQEHCPPTYYASCLINHAVCLRKLQRSTQAASLCELAEPILLEHGEPKVWAACLVNHANCLLDIGDFLNAQRMFDQAGPVLNEGGALREFAFSLTGRAKCLEHFGRFSEALALYEEAGPLFEEHGTPWEFAGCLADHANSFQYLGRYAEALAMHEQADALMREHGSPQRYGLCLMNHALCLERLERLSEGLALYKAAADLLQRHGSPQERAWCFLNRGNCLAKLGNYLDALALYGETRPIFEQYHMQKEEGLCHMNVGTCQQSLGRYSDAIDSYQMAEPLLQRHGLSREFANCLVNHGNCLLSLGRMEDALLHYESAQPILQKHGVPEDYASCLMNHANCLCQLGRHLEGLPLLDEAGELFERCGLLRPYAGNLTNQASWLLTLGRPGVALPLFERAEEILQNEGLVEDYANCLVNHALCLQTLNRFSDALPIYGVAVPLVQRHGLASSKALCLHHFGDCLVELHRSSEALQQYETALQICDQGGESTEEIGWRVRMSLALLMLSPGFRDIARASSLVEEALRTVERRSVMPTRFEHRINLRENYANLYRLAVSLDLIRNDAAAAFTHAQHAKGRALLDLLEGRQQASPDQALQHSVGQQSRGSAPGQGQDHSHDSPSANKSFSLSAVGSVRSLQEVQRVLHPGEMLIDILEIHAGMVVFLITRSTFTHELIPPDDLQRAEQEWTVDWGRFLARLHRSKGRQVRNLTSLGTLYALLIKPFEQELGGCIHLILSPSGLTHRIPFAALSTVDSAGKKRFLSDLYQLSTVPTAASLWWLRRPRSVKSERPLAVLAAAPFATDWLPADPRGGGQPTPQKASGMIREGIRLLPYTGWEVNEISRLFNNQRRPLLGQQATLQNIQKELTGVQVAVLATHGGRSDGVGGFLGFQLFFHAAEFEGYTAVSSEAIYGGLLSLQGVDTVMLSACHLGEAALHGEEAMGFQQAMLSAGARVSVAPIWAVNDPAAAVLSVEYHRALLVHGASVAEAMQQAMERVRANRKWRHPFYWAAMIPSGDGAVRLSPRSTANGMTS
jgi:CHAT domain-containing protein/tetratricopeptide (TPR) repeat protein